MGYLSLICDYLCYYDNYCSIMFNDIFVLHYINSKLYTLVLNFIIISISSFTALIYYDFSFLFLMVIRYLT